MAKRSNNPMSDAWSETHLTLAQWAKRERMPLADVRSSVREGKLRRAMKEMPVTVIAKCLPKSLRRKDMESL